MGLLVRRIGPGAPRRAGLARSAPSGAVCRARCRGGVRPAAALFHRVRRPSAAPATRGAVAFGRRPALYQRLLRDLARHPLPPRASRSNSRVVKRKMSSFPRKREEHRTRPQPVIPSRSTVEILI